MTPSPESKTIPVVRPEAYSESTAWMATYIAGVLKVSNMIWKHTGTEHIVVREYSIPFKTSTWPELIGRGTFDIQL